TSSSTIGSGRQATRRSSRTPSTDDSSSDRSERLRPFLCKRGTTMRAIHAMGLGVVFLMACGGPGFQGFDGGKNGDGGSGDDGTTTDDGGCPFCGVDASNDGATPTCSPNSLTSDIQINSCDDEGDGAVDNAPTCDNGLQLTGPAADMAKAIGLCQKADSAHWGV